MSLYNSSEFLQLLKENAQIADIPLPVTDNIIWEHICKSALKAFSVLYPYRKEITIGDEEKTDNYQRYTQHGYVASYKIPFHQYYPHTILGITSCQPRKMDIFADYYLPGGLYLSADDTISLIADMQAAASLKGFSGRKPTGEFVKPDIVKVYNGYGGAYYDVILKLTHDPSLSTIPDTAFIQFEELATYDLEAFLYGRLKRKTNVNTGVPSDIDLKIDEWAGSKDKYRDLLKEWSNDANIDMDEIGYW